MLKIKINLFEFSGLFKVSFVFRDSLGYKKSASTIYFRNLDNYNKYYIKNCKVTEII